MSREQPCSATLGSHSMNESVKHQAKPKVVRPVEMPRLT